MIKLAQIEEEYKQGKVPESTMLKMAAFRNELEKSAAGSLFMKNLGKTFQNTKNFALPQMIVAGGALGVGTAIHEGIKSLEGMYNRYKLDESKMPAYMAMVRQHPDLAEQEELSKVYFDALWHYSPIMAQEPLSAGAYIKNALNMHHVAQGPLPSVVKEIVDIAKSHHDANEVDSKSQGVLGNIFMGLTAGATNNPYMYDESKHKSSGSLTKRQLDNAIGRISKPKGMVTQKDLKSAMKGVNKNIKKSMLGNAISTRSKRSQKSTSINNMFARTI